MPHTLPVYSLCQGGSWEPLNTLSRRSEYDLSRWKENRRSGLLIHGDRECKSKSLVLNIISISDNRVGQQNITGLHPPSPPSEVLWCLQTVLILSLSHPSPPPNPGRKVWILVRLLFPPALGHKFCLAYTWCMWQGKVLFWLIWGKWGHMMVVVEEYFEITVLRSVFLHDCFLLDLFLKHAAVQFHHECLSKDSKWFYTLWHRFHGN